MAPPAPGLVDRRVEITGPTDKKMTINALNSGAKVWLADFEDANTPLWDNMITGQLNLKDALDRTIDFTSEEGKEYKLSPTRSWPRSWSGRAAGTWTRSTSSSTGSRAVRQPDRLRAVHGDLGPQAARAKGKGPYFYLAKNESYLEARLWNDAFTIAQDALGIPRGTIRATVLIETIPAAFQMEEILYELREHSAGLNAGRWDYLFSVIKNFRSRGRDFVLPDRNSVTMTAPFMRAYTELLVKTCHRRGAHAIGGMAAFIPSRRDPEVNKVAMDKVRQDKTRESGDGFDGSWVAHPDLVPLCREVFDGVLGDRPNQLDKLRDEVSVTAEDLLSVRQDPGEITEAGLRNDISVGLQYLASLAERVRRRRDLQPDGGRGHRGDRPVPGLAVAAQRHHARRRGEQGDPGAASRGSSTRSWPRSRTQGGEEFDAARYDDAVALFKEVALADDYSEFLTLPAYERMP